LPTLLTAAECAARTGLTIRALRVYEEYELIAPARSAGGWRQYGPQDLVKLNTITLLKAAGMSLAQIREITASSIKELPLRQVLEIQLNTWKRRRADAERGQAIVEAALEHLNSNRVLSVDELCNLIRSLEMTQSATALSPSDQDASDVTSSPAVLDSYAGCYQRWEYGVATIRREGKKLLIDMPARPGVPSLELYPVSETEFYQTLGAFQLQYTFVRNEQGAVTAVVMREQGADFTFPRIDAAAAEQLKARLNARIQSKKPVPGSEDALRRFIDGIRAGHPPYEEMSPAIAQLVQQQLPQLQPRAAFLGEIRSIGFHGVGGEGWDVYDVQREHRTTRLTILLSPDGRIAATNAVMIDATVHLTVSAGS
jgi:DNA-binding transcriptional MerR regulator